MLWSNLTNEITQNKFCITGVNQRVCVSLWKQPPVPSGFAGGVGGDDIAKMPFYWGKKKLVALVSFFFFFF